MQQRTRVKKLAGVKSKKETKNPVPPKWVRNRLSFVPKGLEMHVQMLIQFGYKVLPKVFTEEGVRDLLFCSSKPSASIEPRGRCGGRTLRERSGAQVWRGSVISIDARITVFEGTETVRAPLICRAEGRFDLPLPFHVARKLISDIRSSRVLELLDHMCPRGKVQTQNVMMSRPGSKRQSIHTDSSWDRVRTVIHPAPHYYTCADHSHRNRRIDWVHAYLAKVSHKPQIRLYAATAHAVRQRLCRLLVRRGRCRRRISL